MFKPWIGTEFSTSRLLILGESAYSWIENGSWREPSQNHPTDLVDGIKGNLERSQFMKMVSQGLANDEKPTSERLAFV